METLETRSRLNEAVITNSDLIYLYPLHNTYAAPAWNISDLEMCQSPGATTPPLGLLNAEAPGSFMGPEPGKSCQRRRQAHRLGRKVFPWMGYLEAGEWHGRR